MRPLIFLALVLSLSGCAQPPGVRHIAMPTTYFMQGNETIYISFNVSGFTQQARSSIAFDGQVDAAANTTSILITDASRGTTSQFNGSAGAYNPHALLAALINDSSTITNETADAYALSLLPDPRATHALLHSMDAEKGSFSSLFARPETMQSASISVWVDKRTAFITSARIRARYGTKDKTGAGTIEEEDMLHIIFSARRPA